MFWYHSFFFCDFFLKPEKILLWNRSLLNASELKQVLKIVSLIWFLVCFLLSTYISHFVKGVMVAFFFLLYLLYVCDKVSYVCLSFDEWVLKVFCLKVKQQSCLKVSCLKYRFEILLFYLNLALNDLRKELGVYVNDWLIVKSFSEPFTFNIITLRGGGRKLCVICFWSMHTV